MDQKPRIFYGWIVVTTAAFGAFFSAAPIIVFSFSVFLRPLAESFHTGRGAISLAFTIHNVIAASCAPIVGRLIDRHGAKRIILPALAIMGVILISARTIGTELWQLYLFYFVVAPVTVGTTPLPYTWVISRWFDRRRGLALGLMMFGMGLGTIAMPPIAQRLIASFGWRNAFAIFGCVVLLLPIGVVSALLKEDPKELGLSPDGEASSNVSHGTSLPGMEWDEIWRSPTFWLLNLAFFLAGASVHACILHMAALLGDRGFSAQNAALGSAIVGLAVTLGRLASGYLQDRVFAPWVAMGTFSLAAAGMALLWTGSAGPIAAAGAFLVGLGMGAETDIIAFLMSRYFGLRALGTSFGFGFATFVLAGGIGGLLMGVGFDRTGAYRAPLAGFFLATVVAVVLFARLGSYRFPVGHEESLAQVEASSAV
jgi:MFS family permease